MPVEIKNKKVVIIGGAGFIGHNLALELKKNDCNVVVIDSLSVNNVVSILAASDKLPNPSLSLRVVQERLRLLKEACIPLIVKDARDYHALSDTINEINPEIIIHLAAVSHANRSNKDPYSTFDHSLRTLENALDVAKNRVEHFIYFSSSMAYGNFEDGHVDENAACNPIGIYGTLKYCGEKMVIAYNQVFGLNYTIIRPSALYGERCISRRVGQIFIENALADKEVTVSGDGDEKLDFTYIGDLISGVIQALKNDEARNNVFNITFGNARPVSELIEILKTYYPKLKVNSAPRDKLVPVRGTLSIEKAKNLIGYEPKWPLEVGYKKYIDWYREFY